ncbi:MAG: FIST C-terminal domain-containing protein [Treponema sp.]|jgi:hypothetical protein|nr:FIST C-terminal domain-containing protein [Treponema sp.]
MIRLLTAYTQEADDPAKAAGEILEQLDLAKNQLAHSAALLFCHSEFIKSGIAKAVSESLPFETLGCTSQHFALAGASGEIMLTVTVLTGDDMEFAVGLSGPLTAENAEGCIKALYQKTAASLDSPPELVFTLLPTIYSLGGDDMVAALDRACGGIPAFGTSALDIHMDCRHPQIFYQGTAYDDRMALLLLKGPIKPRFFSFAFPLKSVFTQEAVITGAEEGKITGINNMPAISFIKELGLIEKDGHSVSLAFPLVIDYRDEAEPQLVIIHDTNPEGALICSKNVRVGGILNIGAITADYVLESMNILLQTIKKNEDSAGFFVFSCFLRNVVLGGNSAAEIELVQKEMSGFPVPYLFLYSAGEVCPQYTKSGEGVNRFSVFALIACRL